MKSRVLSLTLAITVAFLINTLSAQPPKAVPPPKAQPGRPGFNFGAPPEFDSNPLAKNDREKQALAALDEISKGPWYLNVTTREGRVLRQLTETIGAKRVVEVGTSSGYSTIWLALGARASGGKVFTHEIDPEKIKIAKENFKTAGVEDVIAIIEGDAHETVKQHKEPIDLVFFDADKKGYIDYLQKLLPIVRPGGLVLGHDMHRPMPDPRYIEAITKNPDLETSFLMMESFGMSMTLKKR
jgi:predicted O-methyltransferase YrrM